MTNVNYSVSASMEMYHRGTVPWLHHQDKVWDLFSLDDKDTDFVCRQHIFYQCYQLPVINVTVHIYDDRKNIKKSYNNI